MKTMKLTGFALAIALSAGLITSCSDDDSSDNGGATLPPIGGYNSADEVGSADLIAYWPLNGNGVESKSSTSPAATVGTTWVAGVKGQAAKMTSGYLDYPSIPALAVTSGSITVSTWAKISNTKLVADGVSTISPIISFSGGPDLNTGNLSVFGNTHGMVSSDSIQMKGQFRFKKADGTDFGGDCVNVTSANAAQIAEGWTPAANKIGGQWAHIVYVYDGSNANNRLYVNGVKISNAVWESRNGGDSMPMVFFTPTRPIIGALASVVNGTNTDTWNAALKGEVDEIRVWKKALSASDIGFLYELEKAGR